MLGQIWPACHVWPHQKVPLDMNFQSCGGFHYKFMALSTSSFTLHRVFDSDPPPLNFRSLLRENDRDYDAQNFRIFISHHYLPPHLKRKKSMICCGAHPRCWHGIAQIYDNPYLRSQQIMNISIHLLSINSFYCWTTCYFYRMPRVEYF